MEKRIGYVIFEDGKQQSIISTENFKREDVEILLGVDFITLVLNNGETLFYNNLLQIGSEFNQKASQIVVDNYENGIPLFGKVLILKTEYYEQ